MLRKIAGLLLCLGLLSLPLHAVPWFPLGPYGGDARSLTVDLQDPHHLYLGTEFGWVYESLDNGRSWARLAQIERENDLVIDHILTDPSKPHRLLVGAFTPEHPGGGIFISDDAGKNWYSQAEMHNQSVLSLARSSSDPAELVAGTLKGVFRSQDDGLHWQQISPPANAEIHEVESVAIDPADPQVIYVGTWHLPWKTTDGGAHWESIKKGLIDDSDVFSILVDPKRPQIVYASACSGIYKSVNGAAQFQKIQGIPSTARRTRKLTQDPQHPDAVYAGTTEGLYRTLDAGAHWDRMTSSDLIINDVLVDPTDSTHILLATDRFGVMSSNDMAASFSPSNAGFSARLVDAYAADPSDQAVVYVGVVNDKTAGGVFQSRDGGVKWEQVSAGLEGRDTFSLGVTSSGTLLAGTTHGIYRRSGDVWSDSSVLLPAFAPVKARSAAERQPHSRPGVRPRAAAPESASAHERVDAPVYALVPQSNAVFAMTSTGLLHGDADGQTWRPVPSLQISDPRYIAGGKTLLLAAGLREIAVSNDDGETWKPVTLPSGLTQIAAVAVDGADHLWVGGLQGVFTSADAGMTWSPAPNLSVSAVDSLYFDPAGNRILVTSYASVFIYAVHVPDGKVTAWDTGWKLRFARPVADHLVAASLFDGVVVQPRMVDSAVAEAKSGPPAR